MAAYLFASLKEGGAIIIYAVSKTLTRLSSYYSMMQNEPERLK